MEEINSKKLNFSPCIAKKIIYFEGNCNTHNNRPGTAQHALVGCRDLEEQSNGIGCAIFLFFDTLKYISKIYNLLLPIVTSLGS